jgi:protoheme IX farnesyltransferase
LGTTVSNYLPLVTPPAISTYLSVGQKRFANLLAVTTVTVYAVIATGAAAATSATTCSSWPFCVEWGALLSASTLFVLGHQLLTGIAGTLLVVTLLVANRSAVDRSVQFLLGGGTLLFVVQVVLGALLVTGQVGISSQLHLLVGSVIFVTLLVALGWTLEDPSTESPRLKPEEIEQTAAPSSTADDPETSTASRGWRTTAAAYLELTKPRLMWLLCLLALAGVALATTTGGRPTGLTVVATLAGGVLAIGASGTFNHVAERERDKRMDRTADRPIATEQIPRRNAAAFGLALLVLSMVVMVGLVNVVAAVLTLVAVGYYSVLYTVVLKPNTSWNIAIGGGAGALPAVIGWAAVTGSVGLPALVLAGLVVVWTPAHFYNLAIVYREDYARGGYPMYPVVSGVSAARRRIMTTLGMTLLVTVLLLAVTPLGMLFALSAVIVGAVFLGALVVQCHTRTDAATLRTFHASNAYLGVILLAIVVETVLIL